MNSILLKIAYPRNRPTTLLPIAKEHCIPNQFSLQKLIFRDKFSPNFKEESVRISGKLGEKKLGKRETTYRESMGNVLVFFQTDQ